MMLAIKSFPPFLLAFKFRSFAADSCFARQKVNTLKKRILSEGKEGKGLVGQHWVNWQSGGAQ